MARPKGVGFALFGANVVHRALAVFVKDTVVMREQLFQAKSSIDDSYKLTGKRLNRQIQFLSHFFNFFDRDKDKARRASATFATPGTGKYHSLSFSFCRMPATINRARKTMVTIPTTVASSWILQNKGFNMIANHVRMFPFFSEE